MVFGGNIARKNSFEMVAKHGFEDIVRGKKVMSDSKGKKLANEALSRFHW